jgi:hypothetical protein
VKFSAWDNRLRGIQRWIICGIIGFLTGLIAFVIDTSITHLAKWKFDTVQGFLDKCVQEDCLTTPLLVWVGIDLCFVGIGKFNPRALQHLLPMYPQALFYIAVQFIFSRSNVVCYVWVSNRCGVWHPGGEVLSKRNQNAGSRAAQDLVGKSEWELPICATLGWPGSHYRSIRGRSLTTHLGYFPSAADHWCGILGRWRPVCRQGRTNDSFCTYSTLRLAFSAAGTRAPLCR